MESDNNASSDLDQWQSLDEAGIDSIHRQLIWIWTQFFILTPLLASKRNEIKTTYLIYRVSVWGFIAGGIIYSPDRLPPAPGRSPPAPMQAAPNSVQQPNSNQMRPALSSDLIVVINVDDWLTLDRLYFGLSISGMMSSLAYALSSLMMVPEELNYIVCTVCRGKCQIVRCSGMPHIRWKFHDVVLVHLFYMFLSDVHNALSNTRQIHIISEWSWNPFLFTRFQFWLPPSHLSSL